jgi:uncharacterized surface protein with fasciclin (FAS1) repeats
MQSKRKFLAAIAVAGSLTLIGAACTTDSSTSSSSATAETSMSAAADTTMMTIPEVAAGNEDFSTLVAAIGAADLGETLSGEGPYTVFAPTNDAFAALPEGTLDDLLKPANKDQLTAILTYHVVAGEVMAADVKPGEVTTVNGATFEVAAEDGTVTITDGEGNTAEVVTTDIVGSNGVIHVIDAVLLPPAE